jgi:hypothetical protein
VNAGSSTDASAPAVADFGCSAAAGGRGGHATWVCGCGAVVYCAGASRVVPSAVWPDGDAISRRLQLPSFPVFDGLSEGLQLAGVASADPCAATNDAKPISTTVNSFCIIPKSLCFGDVCVW